MKSIRKLAARALYKAAITFNPPDKTQNIDSEYMKWLSFANAGMLNPGNLYLIDHAIKNLPSSAPILEIGSFCGLSANAITNFKRVHGRRNPLVSCDKWQFEGSSMDREIDGSPIRFSDYREFVRGSFIRNIKMFSPDDLPFTVEMFSDEFFDAWKNGKACTDVLERPLILGGPLSFCYIDGNHSYEFAKRDFLNCDTFLDSGGFILFDDSTDVQFGVRKLMPEIASGGRYKLIATNPNHLFQKV